MTINRLIALNPFQAKAYGADPYSQTLQGFELGRQRQTQLEREAIEQRERNRLEAERQQQMAQQAEANRMMALNPNVTPMDFARAGMWGPAEQLAGIQDTMSEAERRRAQTRIGRRQVAVDERKQKMEEQKYKDSLKPKAPDFTKFKGKIEDKSLSFMEKFDAEVGKMRGGMNKLSELHGLAARGDRTAAAGMVQVLSRMFSPGVVTNEDVKQISAAVDPWAEIANVLAEKKGSKLPDAQTFAKYFDPIGNINADSLLEVGRRVSFGNAPAMLDSYQTASDRALRSGLNPYKMDTIFGANRNVDFLTNLVNQQRLPQSEQEPQQKPQTQARERTRTRQEVEQRESAASQVDPDLFQYMTPEERALFE